MQKTVAPFELILGVYAVFNGKTTEINKPSMGEGTARSSTVVFGGVTAP
jgi:hypothetical protein